MGEQGKDMVDPSGNWVKIKPKDLRKAMEQHRPEKAIAPDKKEDIEIITDESYRKSVIEKVESQVPKSETPETIDIEKPGKYKIDLKGLLECTSLLAFV